MTSGSPSPSYTSPPQSLDRHGLDAVIASCARARERRHADYEHDGRPHRKAVTNRPPRADDIVGDDLAVLEAIDADRSGIDVAEAVERERAEDAVLDLRREQLFDDRRARPVRARDRVEQHLGGLGGLRSAEESRLADVVAELANELLACRREQRGGDRRARHEHALAGGSELLRDVAERKAVRRDDLDARRKRRSEVLDERLGVVLRQTREVHDIRLRGRHGRRELRIALPDRPWDANRVEPDVRAVASNSSTSVRT